jgi:hypothetical protein
MKPAQAVKLPKAICDDFMNTFLEKISMKKPCFYLICGLVTRFKDNATALPSKYVDMLLISERTTKCLAS